jgi:hypothetical protein
VSLTSDLANAFQGMPLDDKDLPAAELAMAYGRAIDADPETVARLGPLLLATLEALLMTPRARAALTKGVNDDQRKIRSPLDELRARRAGRDKG